MAYITLSLTVLLSFCAPDIVLYLCENEHIEGGMIFQLLEDLTEMSTMRNCKDVFGYIESKQDILGKVCVFKMSKDLYSLFFFFVLVLYLIFKVFDYLYLQSILIYMGPHMQPELFARGKLVMLRTCNQLLRRLSKVVLLIIVVITGLQSTFIF